MEILIDEEKVDLSMQYIVGCPRCNESVSFPALGIGNNITCPDCDYKFDPIFECDDLEYSLQGIPDNATVDDNYVQVLMESYVLYELKKAVTDLVEILPTIPTLRLSPVAQIALTDYLHNVLMILRYTKKNPPGPEE